MERQNWSFGKLIGFCRKSVLRSALMKALETCKTDEQYEYITKRLTELNAYEKGTDNK